MDTSISFSKIVATPTLNSWSQAYNAGKLFAVLSLEKTAKLPNEDLSPLNVLGKDLLERLEQEFFTIEKKDLESIKKAILNTFDNIPEGIIFSFTSGFVNDNILYLFILGKGDIFIKRDDKIGKILELAESENSKGITSSSGFLKDKDLIILTTSSFSKNIAPDILNESLESNVPSEITESLAPKVLKIEDGRLAAIIIKYSPPSTDYGLQSTAVDSSQNAVDDSESPVVAASNAAGAESDSAAASKPLQSTMKSLSNKYLSLIYSKIKLPYSKFNGRKKIFLLIALVIAIILTVSIFSAIKNQNNAKMEALFFETYPQAEKKYEEGDSLLGLNKNLARGSFLAAQKILNDNKDKFPAKSKQLSQINDLLKKVESGLAESSPVDKSGLDRSKLSLTVTNGSGIEGTAGKAASILKELGYNNVSTGNADNFDYKGVTIKVKSSKKDFLELLKKDLSKDYTVSSASPDLSSSSPSDTLIIIGK